MKIFKIRNKKSKGFSLVELLLVLVLVGIIMAVLILNVPHQIQKVKDASVKNDLDVIRLALFEYYDDNKCFPKSLPECGNPFSYAGKTYLNKTPCQDDNIKYGYEVENVTCSTWFKILGKLRIYSDPSIDAVGCRSFGCGPNCEYNYGLTSTNIAVYANCPKENKFACTPSGWCEWFIDPEISQCPIVFINDPNCQNMCEEHDNRCHDERGKQN